MGMRRVEGSVARAVCKFNEGATEMISILSRLYVDISYTTLHLLAKKDEHRLKAADAASAVNARRRRKEYAGQRRLNIRAEEARDGNVYEGGEH
ncbi:hypothetical protein V1264_022199 [Littorina saxatilis]|uniref:Uncharacterized protein n=1 Tax=Littorina saxatilis TaxID=31220 RepID=A0AAN9FX04_9CAEN